MITGDALSDAKFIAIMLSLILVPPIWVWLRKEKSTDHERRGAPPPELSEETARKVGLPGVDYELYSPGYEWDKMRREKRKQG